jgi:hypothetical protein
MNIGEATEAVLRDASSAYYSAAATGAHSFRLVRAFRRFGLVQKSEEFDIAVVERRDGVSVHVAGQIWGPLLAVLHSRLHHEGSRPDGAAASVVPSFAPGVAPDVMSGGGLWTPPPMIDHGGAVADAERTVIRPRPGGPIGQSATSVAQGPILRFATGEQQLLTAAGIVIGRNPVVDPELPGALALRIDDRSLSRTHVAIGWADGAVWVADRHSTNGVLLDGPSGSVTCTPGIRTRVPAGVRVVIGDRSFVVDVPQ